MGMDTRKRLKDVANSKLRFDQAHQAMSFNASFRIQLYMLTHSKLVSILQAQRPVVAILLLVACTYATLEAGPQNRLSFQRQIRR